MGAGEQRTEPLVFVIVSDSASMTRRHAHFDLHAVSERSQPREHSMRVHRNDAPRAVQSDVRETIVFFQTHLNFNVVNCIKCGEIASLWHASAAVYAQAAKSSQILCI